MYKIYTSCLFFFLLNCFFCGCSKTDDFSDKSIGYEYYVNGTVDGKPFFVPNDPSSRNLFGYDFKKRTLNNDCLFKAHSGLGTNYGTALSSDKGGFSLYEPYIEIRLMNLKTADNACAVNEEEFIHMMRPRTFALYNDNNFNNPDIVGIVFRDKNGTYWKLAERQPTNAVFEITKSKQADVIPNFVEIIGAKAKCKLIATLTDGSHTMDVNLDFVWRFSRVL
jgi:hypothetical protein